MLILRIITALILAPLFVISIFYIPSIYFSYFLLIFILLASWEFANLVKFKKIPKIIFITVIIAFSLVIEFFDMIAIAVIYLAVFWWFINIYYIINYPHRIYPIFSSMFMRFISGILLLVPLFIAVSNIHSEYGASRFLLLMLLVWGVDSLAYFVGSAIGKHKLAKYISPNKSIEGAIAGIAFSFVIVLWFLQYEAHNIETDDYLYYLILALIISIMSIFGDLYESMLKRIANIKDSGKMLPGHGGILDRIDSLIAAAPFFLLGLNFL